MHAESCRPIGLRAARQRSVQDKFVVSWVTLYLIYLAIITIIYLDILHGPTTLHGLYQLFENLQRSLDKGRATYILGGCKYTPLPKKC